MAKKIKAIGLLSGGLDSTLAARVLLNQGVDVKGVHFYTGFCIVGLKKVFAGQKDQPVRHEALRAGRDLGVEVDIVDISEDYLKMVTHPRHGYGSQMNPCIDCRIHMLREAKRRMELEGASFVFTGEVLGQRPMSQRRDVMNTIEREAGLRGYLLRPLSAKLLKPTIPEKEGWIDPDGLYDIQGRSRKRQIELAQEFGLTDYPQPAGGCCFLTDEHYAARFRDLLDHREEKVLTQEEVYLLAVGRHFRLSPAAKVIVGRNEKENLFLERYQDNCWAFQTVEHPGGLVLLFGPVNDELKKTAASIAARYCKDKYRTSILVKGEGPEGNEQFSVIPLNDDELDKMRI